MGERETPVGLRDVHRRDVVLSVEATALEKQRKQARVSMEHPRSEKFEIACDEGPYLGGDGTAPPPLAYFSAAIAF